MKFENEKFENENRTERIEMRIEPTLKELFGDAADEQGMTMTGFIRTFMIKEARKMQKKIREGKAPTYSDQ